jgi:hypothetical protein
MNNHFIHTRSTKVVKETDLMDQSRPCTICGTDGIHNTHFISDHLHRSFIGMNTTPVNVEMDCICICDCNSCCGCFGRYKREKFAKQTGLEPHNTITPNVIYQSLCRNCSPTNIEPNITYKYCIICPDEYTCHYCDGDCDYYEDEDEEEAYFNCSLCDFTIRIEDIDVDNIKTLTQTHELNELDELKKTWTLDLMEDPEWDVLKEYWWDELPYMTEEKDFIEFIADWTFSGRQMHYRCAAIDIRHKQDQWTKDLMERSDWDLMCDSWMVVQRKITNEKDYLEFIVNWERSIVEPIKKDDINGDTLLGLEEYEIV